MNPASHDRLSDTTVPDLLIDEIKDASAWKRESLLPEDWRVAVPDACLTELDEMVHVLRRHPQPVQHLTPESFSLTACARLMAKVRGNLMHGVGFAVLDRIPVERYSSSDNNAIYLLLARMLGPVVSQKWDGTVLYDVKDAGKALGYGVRRSVTSLAQDFHMDAGWLALPPEVIGLFCLQPAQEGGMSRCVSLTTAHNEMRRRHFQLLTRLYRPFYWDRQAEHEPEDVRFSWHPVYRFDGQSLMARYYEDYVVNGYKLADASLDQTGRDALAAMRAIVNAPENWVEFHLEKGHIEFVNNHQLAHARTAFTDANAPHLRRHMIRLWNRRQGTPHLEGQAPFTA
ncbi:MAG: TauD/TfdA family dioxygenase, partial [Candidatus Tectomicrobia bacterium]